MRGSRLLAASTAKDPQLTARLRLEGAVEDKCGEGGEGQWIPQRQALSSQHAVGSSAAQVGPCVECVGRVCGERWGVLRAWDVAGQQLHTDDRAVPTYWGLREEFYQPRCSLIPIYLQPPHRLRCSLSNTLTCLPSACFSILCADWIRLNSMSGF